MEDSLSIRSYSQTRRGHSHNFHQLVLPLRGAICIEVDNYVGKVRPGECVVISKGQEHHFTANKQARFVVANISDLPESMLVLENNVFSVTAPLSCYLSFIEKQLEDQVNSALEKSMFNTFVILLGEQSLQRKIDRRISVVVEYVLSHLSEKLEIETLAKVACLSPTQFKKIFKEQIGLSVSKYLIKERMEKAQALLVHTDYPIQIIAEQVGYTDSSSFSRRFSRYFGFSPKGFNQ